MSAPAIAGPCHQQYLKDLHAALEGQGLLESTPFWRRGIALWMPAFFLSYGALMVVPFGVWWLLLVPISAMAILTMGFVGHDAGHYAMARRPWVNDLWGHFSMSFLCGMSFSTWRFQHNRHHVHCQEIDGDPDMQFGFLFSVYPNSANWQTPVGRKFLSVQKWAFWPLACFYWVSLRHDAIRALFERRKLTRIDRFIVPLHWLILLVLPGLVFGWRNAISAYLAMSCLSSLMTASVFIPNHIGMRRLAVGEKLSYFEQQITTSRNISNPRLLDFYYGGLNSQIEHHLFPRVSHNRYRAMRPVVKAFCEERGIAYHQSSLFQALAAVGQHLGEMTEAYVASR